MPERATLHEQKAQVLLEIGETWKSITAATRECLLLIYHFILQSSSNEGGYDLVLNVYSYFSLFIILVASVMRHIIVSQKILIICEVCLQYHYAGLFFWHMHRFPENVKYYRPSFKKIYYPCGY